MESDKAAARVAPTPKPGRAKRRLIILLVVAVVIAAGAGIGWYQIAGKLRMSEPYRAAISLVEKDSQVAARLGQPVRDTWLPPSGSVAGENADLMFKVAGPNGKASVRARARKFDGKWAIRTVDVTFADGKRISLSTSAAGNGDGDAPVWTPPAKSSPKPEAGPPKFPPSSSSSPDIQVELPDNAAPTKSPADSNPPAPKSPGK